MSNLRAVALTFAGAIGTTPCLAYAAPPMGYLQGFGPKAHPVVALTWGLLSISIAVVVIITALVAVGIWRRHAPAGTRIEAAPVERGANGISWMAAGLGISSVALVISLVWTVVVLAAVNGPSRKPALTIEITGQQWWWKARYLSDDASRIFTTADEIHIPVGEPVRLRLLSADVIHSFWVPKLGGKMDAIPGQTNETWIEASVPGTYRGECSEFCGAQHAHMALTLVAESPDAFRSWWDGQILPGAAPNSTQLAADQAVFINHCGACHSVRGTDAGGTTAPDLTHLMARGIIAGGVLANTPGNLAGWIANPQSIKPGTHMPNLYLSGTELASVTAYLETLR